MNKAKIIFFGNGPLAEAALAVLTKYCEVIFHARTKDDLPQAVALKQQHPEAYGVLASFGVIIRPNVLAAFEPEGILNIHPSKLPLYRGPSPIESAILAGDNDFSYSIMKLAQAMDAGPIYHQETLHPPLDKFKIYDILATNAATWLVEHLSEIRQLTPVPQDDSQATFTAKLDKAMSQLHPDQHTATEIYRQIVAYQGFPKPKLPIYGKTCIILQAHVAENDSADHATVIQSDPDQAIQPGPDQDRSSRPDQAQPKPNQAPRHSEIVVPCASGAIVIDQLQPEGKKPMSAAAFLNGLQGSGK